MLGWTAGSGRGSSAKTRKKGGRRGLRPWPLRCLSQFLFGGREDQPLRGQMCCVCLHTFHRWGGHVFIVDVLPVGW